MQSEALVVALGERRFQIERPWGTHSVPGKVTDVTLTKDGDVALLLRTDPYTEAGSDPVVVLSAQGQFLRSFGASDLSDAHMIATDPSGRFWVVDRDAHCIVCFDAHGNVLNRLGKRHGPLQPFNHPSDIAFASDGSIVVADGYANGQIHIFNANLSHIRSFGEIGHGPGQFMTAHGVWVTLDHRIIVADRENSRLQVFDMKGALEAIWTGFHRPSDIWGDASGRLYVTDAVPTLTCLSSDGTRLGRCRPVLNGAHGLWGDARDGTLYLAEGTPSRLTRMALIA